MFRRLFYLDKDSGVVIIWARLGLVVLGGGFMVFVGVGVVLRVCRVVGTEVMTGYFAR